MPKTLSKTDRLNLRISPALRSELERWANRESKRRLETVDVSEMARILLARALRVPEPSVAEPSE